MAMKTNGFRDWILGIVALFIVAGALGAVRVYARVGILENQNINLKEDIGEIKETLLRIEDYLKKK